MKQMKYAALLMSGMLLAGAMPVLPVQAEGDSPDIVWDADITLDGSAILVHGSNVSLSGNKVIISASGSYLLHGTLEDGQIVVNVPDEVADPGTVKLYFDNVSITGVSEAPLLIENAENTSINLPDGTVNYLGSGGEYTNTTAVIYAKDDITIKSAGEAGDGKLTVESAYQHGIHCNNDVKISGGNIKIRTNDGSGDGIRGKTSVEIKGGKLDVNAGGDGVKSTKGDVFISGGKTEIKAGNDAVQGETSVQISGGTLKANGDRGLTNAAVGNVITITGGEILATAKDYQVAAVNTEQPVVVFATAEEQVKDQKIALLPTNGDDNTVFEMKPDKKFKYVLISTPAMSVGSEYALYIGGMAAENGVFTQSAVVTELEDIIAAALMRGDPDGNGEVTVEDAMIVLNAYAEETLAGNPSPLTPQQFAASDVDFNGIIDLSDATYVLNYYAEEMVGNEADWDAIIASLGG